MKTSTTSGARLRHQEYARISIPESVPALGVEKGDAGRIRGLHLDNETVLAFVVITYSTGQTRGWVILELQSGRFVRTRPFPDGMGRFANRPYYMTVPSTRDQPCACRRFSACRIHGSGAVHDTGSVDGGPLH